jgi:hypothetical protein
VDRDSSLLKSIPGIFSSTWVTLPATFTGLFALLRVYAKKRVLNGECMAKIGGRSRRSAEKRNQTAGRIGEVSQPASRLSIFTFRLFAPAVLTPWGLHRAPG